MNCGAGAPTPACLWPARRTRSRKSSHVAHDTAPIPGIIIPGARGKDLHFGTQVQALLGNGAKQSTRRTCNPDSSSSRSGERYHTQKNAPYNSLCQSKWQPRVVTRAHLGADDVGAKPRQPSLHCSLRRGHQRGPRLHQPRQARPPFLEAVSGRPAARAWRLGLDVPRGGVRVPQARRRPCRAPHLLLHRVQRRPLAARRRLRGVGGVVFGDVPRVGLPNLCGVYNAPLREDASPSAAQFMHPQV